MTDTALQPIDTSPLAFQAQITGAVIPTADKGVKFSVRSLYEVDSDTFKRICELGRDKTNGFNVFVPDAETLTELPPKPPATDPKLVHCIGSR
jgi:hypothetical protein